MKKIILSALVFTFGVLPVFAFAAIPIDTQNVSAETSAGKPSVKKIPAKANVFIGDAASAQSIEVRAAKQGDRGSNVVAIQKVLIAQGYLKTDATGTFGPKTKAAVVAFQKDNGLSAVGQVGPMTLTTFSNLCTVMTPCNTMLHNPLCPATWMDRPFHDGYHRNVSGDGYGNQEVCDYEGSVTESQCAIETAMGTSGPHGVWCQKFINNNSLLLSIGRVPDGTTPALYTNWPITQITLPGMFSGHTINYPSQRTYIPPTDNQKEYVAKFVAPGVTDTGIQHDNQADIIYLGTYDLLTGNTCQSSASFCEVLAPLGNGASVMIWTNTTNTTTISEAKDMVASWR